MRKTIVVGILGTQLDYVGQKIDRWQRWRPTVALCSQPEWIVDELHLLYESRSQRLYNQVYSDIARISPETTVIPHISDFTNPWDFEEVYARLYDFCQQMPFDEDNQYLLHITTGTHVAQICMFLLTESHHFPGRLLQTSPNKHVPKHQGVYNIIDLDLSKYDQLASRFAAEHYQGTNLLKGGIVTRNADFNRLIAQIEQVALRSKSPMLLTGPTGAGKSQLAKRIFQLKQQRNQVVGEFVAVNCATLQGDGAMSALFGHVKGAYTGAQQSRQGFLRNAHQGVLFLDEIGELSLDEQAMLLSALEQKQFYPVGSDTLVSSDFQLIAGTNRDLRQSVADGRFRADLLARINLWTYALPALKDRPEDIEPNLDYELQQWEHQHGERIAFNREARQLYLDFALGEQGLWSGNFRDLNASIIRLATLASSARIGVEDVKQEIQRLRYSWQIGSDMNHQYRKIEQYLGSAADTLDLFEQPQLALVLQICEQSGSMAAAGRTLFQHSRLQKSTQNDSSRLAKYLDKYGLSWADFNAI